MFTKKRQLGNFLLTVCRITNNKILNPGTSESSVGNSPKKSQVYDTLGSQIKYYILKMFPERNVVTLKTLNASYPKTHHTHTKTRARAHIQNELSYGQIYLTFILEYSTVYKI